MLCRGPKASLAFVGVGVVPHCLDAWPWPKHPSCQPFACAEVARRVFCRGPSTHPANRLACCWPRRFLDFGQNIAGVVRLRAPVRVADGHSVTVRHCEVLQHPPLSAAPVGKRGCWFGELVNALNVDVHTLSANASHNGEWLQPQFTIHGFRYAEVFGVEHLAAGDIAAVVIGANITANSRLKLSSALLQKIQDATFWGQRANTQDIVTDCNQRDERLGWMGDAAISAEEASYNFPGLSGVAGTHDQFLDMIRDGQGDDGAVSDITPTVWQLGAMQPSDPNWGSAYPTLAHQVWKTTGSTDVIGRHLPHIARYIDSLSAGVKASGLAKMHTKYGDWLPPPGLSRGSGSLQSATAFIHDARLVAAMAAAVNDTGLEHTCNALVSDLTDEYNRVWLDAGNHTYASGLQSEVSAPLWLGIVPAGERAGVVETLVANIKAHGYHTTSGILGTRSTYEALAMNGRIDVALQMLAMKDYPSYGYMVENPDEPSTTLWENWGASHITDDQADGSRNHVMFGHVSAFFWKYLAGLTQPDGGSGWRHIKVAPSFGELCGVATAVVPPKPAAPLLTEVDARLDTASGELRVQWRLDGTKAAVNVTVPPASTAEMTVPCVGADATIRDAVCGTVLWRAGALVARAQAQAGISTNTGGGGGCARVLSAAAGEFESVTFQLPAGHYQFVRE